MTRGCAYKILQLVFLQVNDKASDYTCNTECNNRLITYMNKPLGILKKKRIRRHEGMCHNT